MIYVTGDMHGDQKRILPFFGKTNFREDDYLMITGDWGFLNYNSRAENDFLDEIQEKFPGIMCFIDGNHEGFPYIYDYPEEVWHEGLVHRIRKNIFHCMRGSIFSIEDHHIFTFGGGYSIDKEYRLSDPNSFYYKEEMPNSSEFELARHNLKLHEYRIDYIITHTLPEESMNIFHPHHPFEKTLNQFLEWVCDNVTYKYWFCGHIHQDYDIWKNQSILYKAIRELTSNETAHIF